MMKCRPPILIQVFFSLFSLSCCLRTIFTLCNWFIIHITVVLIVLNPNTHFTLILALRIPIWIYEYMIPFPRQRLLLNGWYHKALAFFQNNMCITQNSPHCITINPHLGGGGEFLTRTQTTWSASPPPAGVSSLVWTTSLWSRWSLRHLPSTTTPRCPRRSHADLCCHADTHM